MITSAEAADIVRAQGLIIQTPNGDARPRSEPCRRRWAQLTAMALSEAVAREAYEDACWLAQLIEFLARTELRPAEATP